VSRHSTATASLHCAGESVQLSDTREIGARIIPVLGRRRPHQRNAGRRSNGLKLTLFRGPRYVRPSGSRPTFESRRGFPADGTQSPPSEGARTGSQRPTHWGALMPIQSAGRQRGAKFMCFVCFASLSGSFRRGQAGFAVGPQSHPPRGLAIAPRVRAYRAIFTREADGLGACCHRSELLCCPVKPVGAQIPANIEECIRLQEREFLSFDRILVSRLGNLNSVRTPAACTPFPDHESPPSLPCGDRDSEVAVTFNDGSD
jgi:hypothetical protein